MTKKRRTSNRGSISIFLTIILVPMLMISGVLVDAARYQLARGMVSSAGDLAMNAALANYDTVLKDVYGLFAMSQTEGELQKNLEDYFVNTLISNGIIEGQEDLMRNPLLQDIAAAFSGGAGTLLSMEVGHDDIKTNGHSSLAQAQILKSQIVEFSKYRAPLNTTLSLLDGIGALSKVAKQGAVIQKKVEVDEAIADLHEQCKALHDSIDKYLRTLELLRNSLEEAATIQKDYAFIHRVVAALVIADIRPQSLPEDMSALESLFHSQLDGLKAPQGYEHEFLRDYALYRQKIDTASQIIDRWKVLHEQLPKEDKEQHKQSLSAMTTKLTQVNNDARFYDARHNSLVLEANGLADDNAELITSIVATANTLLENISEISRQLNSVQGAIRKTNEINQAFKEKIDVYDQGKVQDAFSESMRNEAGLNDQSFDPTEIAKLQGHLVGPHSAYLREVVKYGESIKYAGKEVKDITSSYHARKAYEAIVQPTQAHPEELLYQSAPLPNPNFNPSLADFSFWRYLKRAYGGSPTQSAEKEKANKLGLDEIGRENAAANSQLALPVSNRPIQFTDMPSQEPDKSTGDKIETPTSDKGYSEMLSNMTLKLSEVLAGMSAALTTGRDNLLVTDYTFGMFSYYTQQREHEVQGSKNKPLKTMTHVPLTEGNNKMYRSEIEYILYGKAIPQENVIQAKTNIYLVRFVANAAYALTDGEIQTLTLPPALAIQAASLGLIPYQLTQVVMQLSLALAESALDLRYMEKGEKVVLFKTRQTWRLSPSGAVNVAKEQAKQAVNDTTNYSATRLKGAFNKLLDAGSERIQIPLNDVVDDVRRALEQEVTQEIDEIVNLLTSDIIDNLDNLMEPRSAEEVLNQAFARVQAYIDMKPNGHLKTAVSTAFTVIKPHLVNRKGDIQRYMDAFTTNSAREQLEKVKAAIAAEAKEMLKTASRAVTNATDAIIIELKQELKQFGETTIDAGADKVLEVTNTFLDKTFNGFAEKMPTAASGKGNSSALATVMQFDYGDYLKMFLLLKLSVNDEAALLRIADVIQLNISGAGQDSPLKHARGHSFRMKAANTYVNVAADVKLRTMFMSLPFITERVGRSHRYFLIRYKSTMGY